MKKILIVAVILLLCTGCADRENPEKIKESQEDVPKEELQTKKLDIEVHDGFDGEYDFAYKWNLDAQSECNSSNRRIYVEGGLYYIEYGVTLDTQEQERGAMLHFYDFNAQEDVPVCSKSNCTHRKKDCNAFFEDSRYPSFELFYYGGNLYTVTLEEDYLVVQSISGDGAVREDVCRIMRQNVQTETLDDGTVQSDIFYPEVCIHRGYVYYSTYYPGCTSASLCRVALERNAEAEILYVIEGEAPDLYRLKGYGKYLMFQMGEYIDSSNHSINLYALDTEKMNICCVRENVLRQYAVSGTSLYYFGLEEGNGNIYAADLETGEEKLFYELSEDSSDYYVFVREGKVVYTVFRYDGEPCRQVVLDEDGKVLKEVEAAYEEVMHRTSEEWIYPY